MTGSPKTEPESVHVRAWQIVENISAQGMNLAFEKAILKLVGLAFIEGANVLWNTLNVDIERQSVDERTFADAEPKTYPTYTFINLDAEAVKWSSETTDSPSDSGSRSESQTPAAGSGRAV
jgi:hypothetical protein